jgi:dihydroorotate dehydrogenase
MYREMVYPIFSRLDPEKAHDLTLALLAGLGRAPLLLPLLHRLLRYDDPRLGVSLWDLHFPNPLGVAAGLDKNGGAVGALLQMGWGHIEVGTVTPLPQPGNPRPRVFRLPEDRALINRMGFPGQGTEAARARLLRQRRRGGIVGVNIGANKASVEAGTAAADYVQALDRMADVADYLTINISSPNTARLRELQGKAALAALIDEVTTRRDSLPTRKPLLIKLAPDLLPAEIDDIVELSLRGGIDGLVATNTTIGRPSTLRGAHATETGGLSGAPLRDRATDIIRYIARSTAGRVPIIGVGGVFTPDDAFAKLAAGASLIQIYTGFIYEGPALARRINHGLARFLDRHGISSIQEVIGNDRLAQSTRA